MDDKLSMMCLNPQGKFNIQKPEGLKNPRITDLADKTIGIFWDGKLGGDNFCIAIEKLMNQRYPTATTRRLVWGDVEAAEKAKKEVDTFIFAVGDSGMGGWGQCEIVMDLERRGLPGVFVVGDNAFHTARLSAGDAGLPGLRIVSLPSIEYYPNRQTVEGLMPLAEATLDTLIDALTKPLTADEINPASGSKIEIADNLEISGDDYDSLLANFNQIYFDNHWGDGLPLIPPTKEAVTRMLSGTERSPDEIIGLVPFRNGTATIEKIAINAVMAGAKPEYLPVIIAAMEGMTDKDSFFAHMLSSEGSFTCVIMVSGPIGKEIKMNSGVGLMGHCQPANNTIGRAVRLCLINLGYLWPGEIDMALIGRPSPHTFYTFSENMDQNPWESFPEGLGFGPGDSCVTVSTVGGANNLALRVYGGGVVEPWNAAVVLEGIINEVAADRSIFAEYKLGVANPMAHFRKHIIVIHPELAILLKRQGYETKQKLRDFIYNRTMVPYDDLNPQEIERINDRINTKPGGMFFASDAFPEKLLPQVKENLKPGGKVPVVDPEDIHIIVSGSIPGYSFGMTYFRSAHQTRLIRGATLTESGR